MQHLKELVSADSILLLPMATILETGHLIARERDGRRRRSAALPFCARVREAIDGSAPWTPTPFWDAEALRYWIDDFPAQAARGAGMGDFSIIKEWERQCGLHRTRRVRIWSLDKHLSAYDRQP